MLRVMSFINDELSLIYDRKIFYDVSKGKHSIIGINIIGINKNYSVGIYGRIIGFNSVSVCFASPIWHLSKGSYCDGEMTDSIVLDLDCFINLDLSQITSKIGMFRGIPIFTQVEPDIDISLSIVSKNISESRIKHEKLMFEGNENYDQISNLLIDEIKANNLYNKFRNYFNVSNITAPDNENNFKGLKYPIEKLTYVIENEKILGTIDLTEIFNTSILYFLNNFILPDIKNSFIRSFNCMYCGFKFEIIFDSVCPSCGRSLELSDAFESIETRLNLIKNLINKYLNFKLYDMTKDLLAFSELQLKAN